MTTTREQLAIDFQKIKHDTNRGVLNAFLSEEPSLDLAEFLKHMHGDGWSGVIRPHELGAEVLIYRPTWAPDIQSAFDDAEARQ